MNTVWTLYEPLLICGVIENLARSVFTANFADTLGILV